MSRDKLMDLARGREHESFDRSIDVQVSRLRKLLGEDPKEPRYIQTVWGFGYVFVPDGAGAEVKLFPASLLWRTLARAGGGPRALAGGVALAAATSTSRARGRRSGIGPVREPPEDHQRGAGDRCPRSSSRRSSSASPRRKASASSRCAATSACSPRPTCRRCSLFRERIRAIFGPEAEVYVRAQRPMPRSSALRGSAFTLPAGERDYWVAFPRARIERESGRRARRLGHRRHRDRAARHLRHRLAAEPPAGRARARPRAARQRRRRAAGAGDRPSGRCARWRAPSTR